MKILIVDDEELARRGVRKALSVQGSVLEAATLAEALRIEECEAPEIVLLDLNLNGEDGFQFLESVRRKESAPLVIMLTAYGSEKIAVEAIKRGAYDYLAKPFEIDDLRLAVRNAELQVKLRQEVSFLREELAVATGFGKMIGRSPAMQQVFGMIKKVAETDVTVLVTGESGVGKELVAREIHKLSLRSERPMVTVNCAAIPETLIESELFGHEKGAFTGAAQRRVGKFEQAAGGTLFLDEIGDMPLNTQAKILRAIEEKKVVRVGGGDEIETDVRLLSATNRHLLDMVDSGEFREDLYYRLEVVQIQIPPVSQRREDIPLLIEQFRSQFCRQYGKPDVHFSPEALTRLTRYSFPGNVRQLRNLVERLVVLSGGDSIAESDLPAEIRFFAPRGLGVTGTAGIESYLGLPFKEAKEAFESTYLMARMIENGKNITRTAEAIGVHRQSLQKKIKDLELKRKLE